MKCQAMHNVYTESFSKILHLPNELDIPFLSLKVPAGSPCPTDQYIEESINLNQILVKKPKKTFCIKVIGDSMIDAGIKEDDILIVDSSIEATNKKIVVAAIDGALTVKRLIYKEDKILLCPENSKYSPIQIHNNDLNIWGVVTFVIHKT